MLSSKAVKIITSVSSVVLMGALAVPANALSDTVVDALGRSMVSGETTFIDQPVASDDSMPENPEQDLPDSVDESIPDDATVVSQDLAVTDDGEVKDVATGETVTDPELVGTQDTPADPLAKTDGESFIPVAVSDVKDAIDDAQSDDAQEGGAQTANTSENATVSLAALQNNEYGAYWGTYNNTSAFFEADGTPFAQSAKGVIDVSSWQGKIDWAAAKADGVEGAIIRIGYGAGNGLDTMAAYNISECKRLGIPFGVYLYSYADTAALGTLEGEGVVDLLNQAGVSPNDLSYPVFYDLERWTWTGHTPPTDPAVYEKIVDAWYTALQSAGYTNLGVYSYTSYLNGPLNSTRIHARTRWVAQYGAYMQFTAFSTTDRAWQYTSGGSVNGISGRVDLNAFGQKIGASNGNSNSNGGSSSGGTSTEYPGNMYYFSNTLNGGTADKTVAYGRSDDIVFSGDWNGDGKDTLAVRRGRTYYIKNSIESGAADIEVNYGLESDDVLVGDWDGDGKDTLAVRRGNVYYIKNSIAAGSADVTISYGRADDIVLVGDWDGDGKDTLAVRRGNAYYVKNSIESGNADTVIYYGKTDDEVLVGDWDGDGKDTFAVRRGRTYYIKNSIASGAADIEMNYGLVSDSVLVGDWDGDGKDTFAVRR